MSNTLAYCRDQALSVLYECYEELREKSVRSICDALSISIETAYFLGPKDARLCRHLEDYWFIKLPENLHSGAWQDYMVCHELGHFFLLTEGFIAPLDHDEYCTTEAWCDTFAAAIVLYQYCLVAISNEEFLSFSDGFSSEMSVGERDVEISRRLKACLHGKSMSVEFQKFLEFLESPA